MRKVRHSIKTNCIGNNVLRYLLVRLNNKIIKDQYSDVPNFSELNISTKTSPFQSLPFAMSLRKHQTNLDDLLKVFDVMNREDELFYRRIRLRTEMEGSLYHSLEDLNIDEEKADSFMQSINSKLQWKPMIQIDKTGLNYFIKEYEETTKIIIDKLIELSKYKMENYYSFADSFLSNPDNNIDSEEKQNILLRLFSNTAVALIYGAAGTGKSTLAKYVSNMFANSRKVYIANTNPAVINMYRKIGGNRDDFMTINSYLYLKPICDFLFIDECSMVSNKDMAEILGLQNFKYLILVGDIAQIQSIEYGTWFKLTKSFLTKNCKYELNELHRTSMPDLKTLWDEVRKKNDIVDEILSSGQYVREFNCQELFYLDDDQIILSLNYDGLYGINNLNQIFQEKNEGKEFSIGSLKYKINDPIIFTENNKFARVLYNNLKGKIMGFKENEFSISILLNVESSISEKMVDEYDEIIILENCDNGSTNLLIEIAKEFDSDEDEINSKLIPFQIAYAVSVHKAQGLEYKTVKIVISDDLCDEITHDIFYTAITRATERLKIFWSEPTQKNVLAKILSKEEDRNIAIFSSKFDLKIRE